VNQPLDRDLATYVHFFASDGQPLGQEDHAPCCEAVYGYRTAEWDVGSEIADTFRPPPSGTGYVQIGMYALDNGDIDPYGRSIEIQLAPVDVSQTSHPLDIELGNRIMVRGYELSEDPKNLKLTVYWQARGHIDKDYTTFVHVLDSSGKILQQVDRQPIEGVFPTSWWRVGQIVRDSFLLPASIGQATLEFGLYDSQNGRRLPRADGEGDTISLNLGS
jgi:hypothetical protein